MKAVIVILDGLGDRAVAALGDQTPLEAALTPVMDRFASTGRYGVVDPVARDTIPNTHSGAGILLGMAPDQCDRLSRGPVEASGQGIKLQPGDVALRANFACLEQVNGSALIVDRRAGRNEHGLSGLAQALAHVELGEGVVATLRRTDEHRAVLVLRGPGLHPDVSDTDPGGDDLPAAIVACAPRTPEAAKTASFVNRFVRVARARLADHPLNQQRIDRGLLPANCLITRGAGAAVAVDNVIRNQGLRAAVVSACNTVKGLGRLFDFAVTDDERFTGDLNTDLDAKIETVLSSSRNNDLVFLHIKAPDTCAHDRKPLDKKRFLEKVDFALAPLAKASLLVAVAADHTTDSNTGLHTKDPVPAFINVPTSVNGMAMINFGESACRGGNLARCTGSEFLQQIIHIIS